MRSVGRLVTLLSSFTFTLSLAPGASAQGMVDRLDLRGQVMFPDSGNAATPFFDETMTTGVVTAMRVSGTGVFLANAAFQGALPDTGPFQGTAAGSTDVTYSVAVGQVDAGSEYLLAATGFFDPFGGFSRDVYNFDDRTTGVITSPTTLPLCTIGGEVRCLNSAAVFSECAALVRVQFVLASAPTTPLATNDVNFPRAGTVTARQVAPTPGASDVDPQALTVVAFNHPVEFPIQAGVCNGADCGGTTPQDMEITIAVTQGEDPFCDTAVTELVVLLEDVDCGEVRTITVTVPDISDICCGCGTNDVHDDWQIVGPSASPALEDDVVYFDDRGSPVDATRVVPRVVLDRGTSGNLRLGKVSSPNTGTTSNAYPPSATMAPFVLYNVIESDDGVDASGFAYRAWDIHVLNDGATSFTASGSEWEPVVPSLTAGSSRRGPCGPGLLPCGRVGYNETSLAEGNNSPADRWTTGFLLFSDCDSGVPATTPPIGGIDSEQDWLYIDNSGAPLVRCPPTAGQFLPVPGACVTPFVPGGAAYGTTDEIKLFALAPGQLRGALKLTDGDGVCSEDLPGVLEHVRVDTALFDDVTGGLMDGIFMKSNVEATGIRISAGLCTNDTALDVEDRPALFRSNLLHNPEVTPSTTLGEQEWHYRIVPAQLGNLGGYYRWNQVRLAFDSDPDFDRDDFMRGVVLFNQSNDPTTTLGDSREREFTEGMNVREDMEYCFGELVFRVRSENADISEIADQTSFLQVRSRNGDVGTGEPFVALAQFEGTVFDGPGAVDRWIQFNVPLPANDQNYYDLTPLIFFEGATGLTRFPSISPDCPVECGRITKICGVDDLAPIVSIQEITALRVPLNADCEDATGALEICVSDCNGNDPVCPGQLGSHPVVDVLLCTDDATLGASDSRCPAGEPYLIASPLACSNDDFNGTLSTSTSCPSSHPYLVPLPSMSGDPLEVPVTDDVSTCTGIVFPNLPIGDGCNPATTYTFVVTDRAVCSQEEPLPAVGDLTETLTVTDVRPPTYVDPADVWACAEQHPTTGEWGHQVTDLCIDAADDCFLAVSWTVDTASACETADAGGTTDCAAGFFPPGPHVVTFELRDCEDPAAPDPDPPVLVEVGVNVLAPPEARINGSATDLVVDGCNDGSVLYTLNGAASLEDVVDDCISSTLTYDWFIDPSSPCTLQGTVVPSIKDLAYEAPSPTECFEPVTCEVTLRVTKSAPSPSAVSCWDEVTYTLNLTPRPVAAGEEEVKACALSSQAGHTDVELDGCDSASCNDPNDPIPPDDGLLWNWSFNASDPGCENIELIVENPSGNHCTPIVRFHHPDMTGEPRCADCEIRLQVTDPVTDCVSAERVTRVIFREEPVAVIATIDPFCIADDPAGAPTEVPLDGTQSIPQPADSCCSGLRYQWHVQNCTSWSGVFTDPANPSNLNPDRVAEPVLVIPAGSSMEGCELCLTVSHCVDDTPPDTDAGCVSETVCVPLVDCEGPVARFTPVFVACTSPGTSCGDPVLVCFRNESTNGDCEDDSELNAEWTFGGKASERDGCDGDLAPDPIDDPFPVSGAESLLGSCGAGGPFVELEYDDPGVYVPTLTLGYGALGSPPPQFECQSTWGPSCGICVPECITVEGTNGPPADGGLDFQVVCNDDDPCADTPDLVGKLVLTEAIACCERMEIAPGARVSLSFTGCGSSLGPFTVNGMLTGSGLAGNDMEIDFFFLAEELVDALSRLGCDCSPQSAIQTAFRFEGVMTCCDSGSWDGCVWPLVVELSGPERFPFSLTCQGGGCMPERCFTELDCDDGVDNDGDLDADCADSECDSYDRDGDGEPACSGGVPVDCNDGDPAINSSKPELCWNGVDDDCDGLADLVDDDCSSPPYSPCN